MNNKYLPMVVVGVIALLVGLFAGYYYEKTKFVKLMADQAQSYQTQLDDAKKMASVNSTQPTGVMTDAITMPAVGKYGNIVADSKGMTLYTYDKDSKDVSNCSGQCLVNWPPYLVTGSAPTNLPANLGTFTNVEGKLQYTWKGMPLYYYIKDTAKGDVNGDGVLGVWHVAK